VTLREATAKALVDRSKGEDITTDELISRFLAVDRQPLDRQEKPRVEKSKPDVDPGLDLEGYSPELAQKIRRSLRK